MYYWRSGTGARTPGETRTVSPSNQITLFGEDQAALDDSVGSTRET